MMSSRELLIERLSRLDQKSQRRSLQLAQGKDFCSNDYLGFAADSVLKQRIIEKCSKLPIGSAGSRLLSGNLEIHEKVEKKLAEFSETESALLFPSGYQANVGLLSGLLTENDSVYSDELNHASLIDGIRLSRAKKKIYRHSDAVHLQDLLEDDQNTPGLKVIITESIFSMDGDIAPLRELAKIAERFSALLIVDEAHATGLFGDFKSLRGSGLVSELGLKDKVFATIHTGGKSFGASGAWVAGGSLLRDLLINFSRAFIFSTAPMPIQALALQEAVSYWDEVGINRAKAVRARCRDFRKSLGMEPLDTPIVPILIGSNEETLRASARAQSAGFDIRAIRPPTVPEGTSRFRITLKWLNSKQDCVHLADTISIFAKIGFEQ